MDKAEIKNKKLANVKNYFNENSANYNDKRNSGLLGFIRNMEDKAALSLLNPKKGEFILDVGCGDGHYSSICLKKGAKVFGIDISPAMIEIAANKGIPGKVCNVENFSLNKKFDKIIAIGVIEYTSSPEKVLKNLAQHLKKGGKIVVLNSRPSIGTYFYYFINRLRGLRIKIISYKKLKDMACAAGLKITGYKILPFFGGVAALEHKN